MSITEEQVERLYSRARSMLSKLPTWPPMEPKMAFAQARRDHDLRAGFLDPRDAMALDCILLLMTFVGAWPPASPSDFIAGGAFEEASVIEVFAKCAKALAPPDRESMH